jgi:hypothetical protein
MTDHRNEQSVATKKRLADERAAREKKHAEQHDASAGWKPTPTQDENDLTASGEHVTEHEPDGSPPDPNVPQPPPPEGGATSAREAKPSQQQRGDYQTRAAAPAAKHE